MDGYGWERGMKAIDGFMWRVSLRCEMMERDEKGSGIFWMKGRMVGRRENAARVIGVVFSLCCSFFLSLSFFRFFVPSWPS